jgi:acetoin utilization deacetylase AcuC-like enzyme
VSILDWDVHFGQGVKDILMPNSRARYVSIHRLQPFLTWVNISRRTASTRMC